MFDFVLPYFFLKNSVTIPVSRIVARIWFSLALDGMGCIGSVDEFQEGIECSVPYM